MRKKLIFTLIASFVLSSLLTPYAFAQSAVVSASYVNMRSGPGLNYSVVNCLAKGASIEVTDSSNSDWYAISYNNQTGYMSSKYISLSTMTVSVDDNYPTGLMTADEYDAYVASHTPSPSPTVTASPSPSPSAEPQISSTPEVSATAEPSPTVTPASSAESTASVQTAESTSTPDTSGSSSTGTITGDYVRFRTGPGTTYTIMTMYNKGQSVSILGYEGDWVKCTINGQDGYVSKTYVKTSSDAASSTASSSGADIESITSPSSQLSSGSSDSLTTEVETSNTDPTTGYINGNNVRFRTAPSLSSDIIKEFYFGNSIQITGTSGEWTAVTCDGQNGYVFSTYVKEGTYTTTTSTDTSTGDVTGDDIVNYAMQYLGSSYKYGGQDPSTGFDCSGFVYYVYGHFNIKLNRTAQDQSLNGTTVSAADLQPGDILCFYTSGSSIGHSGIYIGDNKFIHAANSRTGVIITQLSGYYADRGYVARRIL